MSVETLIVFTVAALILNISPGPSNLYVMSRSIAQGPAAGAVSAAGLACGSLMHVAAAALGLSALFLYSPAAFTVVRMIGAAYLIYLGLRHFLPGNGAGASPAAGAAKPRRRIFVESIFVEALNPKTALFFLAFLPPFVDPAAGPPAPQILLLGSIVILTGIPCDLLVAFASGSMAASLRRRPLMRRLRDWLSGSVLVGLGAWVAFSQR